MAQIRVFVSATTADLGEHRQAATNVLLGSDFSPVVQPAFAPDERPLAKFLRDTIEGSDVVICIVGFRFGEYPESTSPSLRSYTQLEYDFAREFNKPIFVFFAHECSRPTESKEPAALVELQQKYRESLLNDRHIVGSFRSVTELENLLLRAQSNIRRAAGRVPVYFRHLPSAPAYFAGRNEELDELRSALARRIPGLIAVIGIGGQGKSTLVHRVLRDRTDLVLQTGFWCTAFASGYSFDLFLDNALEHLSGGKFDKQRSPTLANRVTEVFKYLQKDPVLIVIDGLESWLGASEKSASTPRRAVVRELDDFLKQASGLCNGSHVVITSRILPASLEYLDIALVPVREVHEKRLGLEGLDPDAAVDLLRSFDAQGDDDELKQVAARLGFHPLALRLVGAFVAEHFGGHIREMPSWEQMDPEGALQGLFYEMDQRLPQAALARRVLQVVAHSLDAPSINLLNFLLQDDVDAGKQASQHLHSLLTMLARFQLLTFDAHSGLISIHPLVQTHFVDGVSTNDSQNIHRRYSQWYAAQKLPENCSTLEEVNPRLLALEHALLAKDSQRCRDLLATTISPLHSLVVWFSACGHFTHGIGLLARILEITDESGRAQLLVMRSAMCMAIGSVQQAIEDLDLVVQSLNGATTVQERITLASALSNRGNAFVQAARSGFYKAALADLNRSIEIFRDLSTQDASCDFGLASAMVNRGNLRREIGRLTLAIDDFTEALGIHTRRLEPLLLKFNPELAAVFVNRGNAFSDLRRLEESLQDYKEAEEIFAILVRIGRSEFRAPAAHARMLQGTILQKRIQHREAIELFNHSVGLFQQLVDSGKLHLEPTFAFGLMSRALSLSCIREHNKAIDDSDAARSLLSRLVSDGREDVSSEFVHSLFVSSFVHYNAADAETGDVYRQAAVSAAQRLILRGENDLRLIVIRYTIASAQAIIEKEPSLGCRLMEEAVVCAETTNKEWSEGKEGLVAEVRAWLLEQANCGLLRDTQRSIDRLRDIVQ